MAASSSSASSSSDVKPALGDNVSSSSASSSSDLKPALGDDNVAHVCDCVVCGLLVNGFSLYNFGEKKKLILKGRPTPPLNLVKQNKTFRRHFLTSSYDKCEWLTGCPEKCLLYCWPCLLFGEEKNVWNRNGFLDLNNLHKLVKRHATSKPHLHAILCEKTFGKTQLIKHAVNDTLRLVNEQHNKRVKRNREILKRFIDVTCFLGEHNFTFGGYDDSEDASEKSNYEDLVDLVAKYDELLKCHLENATMLTSNFIQNDLISCLGEIVLKKIKKELQETRYIAIILNKTTNISRCCQLSTVIRYVSSSGAIKERFLGFQEVTSDRNASALYDVIQRILDKFECGDKLVAQSYDGAAVKSQDLGAIQALVNDTYPDAIFTHCMAHRLNLVLEQSVSKINDCKVFFSTLRGLAAFFSKSSKRSHALDIEVNKVRKVAPTTWDYNGRVILTVKECREPLIDLFENILDNPENWDSETTVSSRGYLNLLNTDFMFNFLLIVFADIFPFADELFSVMQNKTSDVEFCVSKIKEFRDMISSKRKNFNKYWTRTSDLSIKPMKKRKKLDNDVDLGAYHRRLFYEIFDIFLMQVHSRFNSFINLKFLELLNFSKNEVIDEKAFASLKKAYNEHFDLTALRAELVVINKSSISLDKSGVSEMLQSLKECGLEKSFVEVTKLCELALTIPASTSMECSSSALKRIEKYAKNVTRQEGVTNTHLPLLSIEKDLIQEMKKEPGFYDAVIDEFAMVDRRISLTYK